MKKKIGILIITTILIISPTLIKKEEKKDVKEETNPFEVLGSLAYTLDGEKTNESYETLITNNEVNKITCEKGTIAEWNNISKSLKLKNLKVPDYCTIDFKSKPKTLYNQIIADHPIVLTRSSFDAVVGTEVATSGTIYKTNGTFTEDGSDVYYFAGNVADNWVKFGGYYWRIIRTNEDGSVRLLYAGTSPNTTEGYINASQAYNGTYNNTMYVGYMYGSTGSLSNNRTNTTSSPIKTTIDNWYRDNINGSYGNYVSQTAIYCNDRSGDGYAASGNMGYAAFSRLYHLNQSGRKPTYRCGYNSAEGYITYSSGWVWNNKAAGMYSDANNADKFTKSTTTGNGKLTYPVALMTADEVAYAGGVSGTNSSNTYYYLNSVNESVTGDKWWWTMSSYYAYSRSYAFLFGVYGSAAPGRLTHLSTTSAYAVRPVLSLKSCVLVSGGKGTSESPYEVEIDKSCEVKEN